MNKYQVIKTVNSIELSVRRTTASKNSFDEVCLTDRFLYSIQFEYDASKLFTRMVLTPISNLELLKEVTETVELLKQVSGLQYERLYHAILGIGAEAQ